MRAHPKPKFSYPVNLSSELQHLDAHRALPDRKIPARSSENVLIATWNLTNFGVQKRHQVHLQLMAEILKPFDVVALQEIADNLADLSSLVRALGNDWSCLYTDPAGNDERLAFLYNQQRVESTGLAAELAMRGYERAKITIEDVEVEDPFPGFNRNPCMVGFKANQFEFTLVNVHLYWSHFGLRQLETMALGKWAKSRVGKKFPPNNDIILIGDFNLPKLREDDAIFRQLKRHGLALPKHTTDLIGTNLAGDAHYDEIAFFPSRTGEDFSKRMGVFDFDNAIFPDLYQAHKKQFFQYIRYYISDHRPLWAEFKSSAPPED